MARVSVVLVAVAAALSIATAAARSPAHRATTHALGPVPERLLRFLTPNGPIALELARPRTTPRLARPAAVRDALRLARWRPASATGISLVRVARTGRNPTGGVLAWLVSVKPRRPVYDGSKTSRGPAGNYFVVLVSADNGRFIGSAAGYSPQLAGHRGGSGWGEAELGG
jgi:hypothetical protein